MKIIISPAKTMRDNDDGFSAERTPLFLDEANQLLKVLKNYSSEELSDLMKCNKKIAELNYDRFQRMKLNEAYMPALFSYDGLQYKSMAPHVFNDKEYKYIQEHLVILSGFYGMLRPDDAIRFYRLEMQTELAVGKYKNLYEFWADKLYKELYKENGLVINLASKEYSKTIEPYLKESDRMIECVFGYLDKGKVKVKGTLAKMARGAMVRWMAENNVTDASQLKQFTEQGFCFSKELSTDNEFIYIRQDS